MTAEPSSEAEILTGRTGALGRIRLNRPKALNSLTLGMVRAMARALDRFEADGAVGAVLVTGEGERGFCAGGDIKAIFASRRDGTALAAEFWREEYRLNARIASYPKPYVAIMDGITMGGGVGLSAHGRHRVVTERTRLAMPETGIGFLPDVGATWLLARAPGETGTYLGLCGEAVGGADAIALGLADALVPSADLPALVAALEALPSAAGDSEVRRAIERFAIAGGPAPMVGARAEIDRAFAGDAVEAMVDALAASTTEFAARARASLAAKSPTSLKLTLRLLRAARAGAGLEACLEREYAAALAITAGPDFREGVRAAVIDKDRRPRWRPATLAEVGEAEIDALLVAPGAGQVFSPPVEAARPGDRRP